MLPDDVTNILFCQDAWGVAKIKVENGYFDSWTEKQYLPIEYQIPKSLI